MKSVKIASSDIFELRHLRDQLQNKVNSEVESARRRATSSGGLLYKTSHEEREAQHGLDVVNHILKQL